MILKLINALKKTAKNKHSSRLFLIGLSALLCLVLSLCSNPVSKLVLEFYSAFSIHQTSEHSVFVTTVHPETVSSIGHYPLSDNDLLEAIRTAQLFGAKSVAICSIFSKDNSSFGLKGLLSQNESISVRSRFISYLDKNSDVHVPQALISPYSNYSKKTKLLDKGKINFTGPVFLQKHYGLLYHSDDFYNSHNALSFYSTDLSKNNEPLFLNSNSSYMPHIAVKTASDILGAATIKYSWGLLTFYDSKGILLKKVWLGFTTSVLKKPDNNLFIKKQITMIPVESLVLFSRIVEEKERNLTLLSGYTDEQVYSDLSQLKQQLHTDIINNPGDRLYRTMYAEAYKDSIKLENIIMEKSRKLLQLKKLELSYAEKKGIQEAIDKIEAANIQLAPLLKIEGGTVVIDDSHKIENHKRPKSLFEKKHPISAGYNAALTTSAFLNNSLIHKAPFLINIVLSSLIAFIIFRIYTIQKKTKIVKTLLFISIGLFCLNFLIFSITHFFIDPWILHGQSLFAILFLKPEPYARALYQNMVRLKYGVNLPAEKIAHISESDTVPQVKGKHKGIVLYFSFTCENEINQEFMQIVSNLVYKLISKHQGLDIASSYNSITAVFYKSDQEKRTLQCITEIENNIKKKINDGTLKKYSPHLKWNFTLDYGILELVTIVKPGYNFISAAGAVIERINSLSTGHYKYNTHIIVTDEIIPLLTKSMKFQVLDKVKYSPQKHITVLYQAFFTQQYEALNSALEEFLILYSDARKLYYQKKFSEARDLFRQALKLQPENGPVKLFIKRSSYYLTSEDPLVRTVEIK